MCIRDSSFCCQNDLAPLRTSKHIRSFENSPTLVTCTCYWANFWLLVFSAVFSLSSPLVSHLHVWVTCIGLGMRRICQHNFGIIGSSWNQALFQNNWEKTGNYYTSKKACKADQVVLVKTMRSCAVAGCLVALSLHSYSVVLTTPVSKRQHDLSSIFGA